MKMQNMALQDLMLSLIHSFANYVYHLLYLIKNKGT